MLSVDLLGYLAGAFLLLMAAVKDQRHMRMCNIAGNVCFVAYGFLAGVMPVLILNLIIMGLHAWRLMRRSESAQA